MPRDTILAGDIGGTNTRLLLFEVRLDEVYAHTALPSGHKAPGLLLLNKRYQNQDYNSFAEVVVAFLEEAGLAKPPLTACFAVAGPVKDNVVRFTNRASWSIDGDEIGSQLNISRVRLCNDFLAVGYGLLTLDESVDCITLQQAPKKIDSPIACIGAGTGLGECFLAPTGPSGGNYQCFPTEGGHAEFAPRNALEVELLTFLKSKFQQAHRVSVERVVSGSGLVNVYEFLCQKFPQKIDQGLHALIDAAGDLKGAVIAQNRLTNELCRQTMDIFVTAYGAEAGVAGLKWLPYGGLYLTGGLTPKNIDLIKDPNGPFMTAFMDKGRVSGMLCSIPIYAVLAEDLGERGAHRVAYQELQSLVLLSQSQSQSLQTNPTSAAAEEVGGVAVERPPYTAAKRGGGGGGGINVGLSLGLSLVAIAAIGAVVIGRKR